MSEVFVVSMNWEDYHPASAVFSNYEAAYRWRRKQSTPADYDIECFVMDSGEGADRNWKPPKEPPRPQTKRPKSSF